MSLLLRLSRRAFAKIAGCAGQSACAPLSLFWALAAPEPVRLSDSFPCAAAEKLRLEKLRIEKLRIEKQRIEKLKLRSAHRSLSVAVVFFPLNSPSLAANQSLSQPERDSESLCCYPILCCYPSSPLIHPLRLLLRVRDQTDRRKASLTFPRLRHPHLLTSPSPSFRHAL